MHSTAKHLPDDAYVFTLDDFSAMTASLNVDRDGLTEFSVEDVGRIVEATQRVFRVAGHLPFGLDYATAHRRFLWSHDVVRFAVLHQLHGDELCWRRPKFDPPMRLMPTEI